MRSIRCMLVLLVMSWAAAVAHGQTLADIARQERERRRAMESKRVFTNESITPAAVAVTAATEGTAATAATPAAAAKADGAKPKGAVDRQGHDEKYWRAAFDNARQDLKRAENRSRLSDLKVTDLSSQLLREGRAAVEVELRADLERARTDQMLAKIELQQAQQKITDLEDELRRSGGLPGWAR